MTIEEKYQLLISDDVRSELLLQLAPDIHQWLLNAPKHLTPIKNEVADQLLAKVKAQKKLPEWYANPDILWPPPISIEQASSAEAAAFKTSLFSGDVLTDLTGGSGIDLLALSQNFSEVYYVEQNEWLCKVFEHNARILDNGKINIKHGTAEDFITKIEPGQSVYLDPARRDSSKNKVFKLEDCSPNILNLTQIIQDKGLHALIKLSPLLDIKYLQEVLRPHSITILSINNECKELLVLIKPNHKTDKIEAVNIQNGKKQYFEFTRIDENNANATIGNCLSYIYEPNAAIMKAGAFNLLGTKFGLDKLASNTHLYTSENLNISFPGRVFKVIRLVSAKEMKRELKETELHVISRNFPIKASEITRKYRLKEAGNQYLIGFTDQLNKKQMVLTELVKNVQIED